MNNATVLYNFPPGNIIPHEWYKHITTKSGKPDLPAITVLSEIVYWFRPKTSKSYEKSNLETQGKFRGNAWQTSYSYLQNKFYYNHQRIRRALIRLEELELVNRKFQTVHLRGQKYNNILFIELNFQSLEKISYFNTNKFVDPYLQNNTSYIDKENKKRNIIKNRSSESKFLKNFEEELKETQTIDCSEKKTKEGREEEEVLPIGLNLAKIEAINLATDTTLPSCCNQVNTYLPQQNDINVTLADVVRDSTGIITLEKSSDQGITLIQDNKVSQQFSSNQEAFLNIEQPEQGTPTYTNFADKIKANLKYQNICKKPLQDFHPITTEEASTLRIESGREFSTCYINKLILHLAKKYPNNSFYGKKQVLAYLTKALKYELRQAPKVNNEGFKFKAGINKEEARAIKIEKYLSETEYNQDISQESQLRRKIAAVFESEFAYDLLNYTVINDIKYPALAVSMSKLPKFDQGKIELLLNQVSAVYGSNITRIDITFDEEEYVLTRQGIVKVPKLDIKSTHLNSSKEATKLDQPVKDTNRISVETKEFEAVKSPIIQTDKDFNVSNHLWKKIRAKLITYYGEAIDKSWFSKLTPYEEDSVNSQSKKNNVSNEETNQSTNLNQTIVESDVKLNLKAPTHFIKDWIRSNYLPKICQFAKEENYINYQDIKILGPGLI